MLSFLFSIFCTLAPSLYAFSITSQSQSSLSYNGILDAYPGYILAESSVYVGHESFAVPCLQSMYEVRAAGCYESDQAHNGFRIHNGGPMYVNLRKCGGTINNDVPLVLVLTSYENTWWIIDSVDSDIINNINLHEILVYAYHTENSTVALGPNLSNNGVTANGMSVNYGYYGYGSDMTKNDNLMTLINNKYNSYPYSFIGAYEYETVYLCVGSQYQSQLCSSSSSTPPTTDTPSTTATNSVTSTKSTTMAAESTTISPTTFYGFDIISQSQSALTYNGPLDDYPGYILDESSVYAGHESFESFAVPCVQHDYEVRAVGCYESDQAHSGFQQHNGGPMYVNLRKCGGTINNDMPLVLVLTSYENTWWIVDSEDADIINNVNLHQILVYAYHTEDSTVALGPNLSNNGVTATNGMSVNYGYYGYGSDMTRNDNLMTLINNKYNSYPYSFIGAYEYETIYLCVGSQYQSELCSSSTPSTTDTNSVTATTMAAESTTSSTTSRASTTASASASDILYINYINNSNEIKMSFFAICIVYLISFVF